MNQRFDKIIAITKTSSILSQWTYFSSQTFQKIQCNVSDTFVLNYYLLQTLTKVSINLRDRRKVSVIKLVFIENQEKLETYYIFGTIVKDHKFFRFFKINLRHKTIFKLGLAWNCLKERNSIFLGTNTRNKLLDEIH